MMDKLLRRVKKDAAFELEESKKNYEERFTSQSGARFILLEELEETIDELKKADGLIADLREGQDMSRSDIRFLEGCMLNLACEAIQSAAMCRKWLESLPFSDAS